MTGQVYWGSLWRDQFCCSRGRRGQAGPGWPGGRSWWWLQCWGGRPDRDPRGRGREDGLGAERGRRLQPTVVPWRLPGVAAAVSPAPGPPATAGSASRRRPSPWRPGPAASRQSCGPPARGSGSGWAAWRASDQLASSLLWWEDGGRCRGPPLLRSRLQTCWIRGLLLIGIQVLELIKSVRKVFYQIFPSPSEDFIRNH